MNVTAYSIAERYLGMGEVPGEKNHPFIQWCFSLCSMGLDTPDSVAWCSAFLQHPFWELNLPRSKHAGARSWLQVGRAVILSEARKGFDVVVFYRGLWRPGREVLQAPGHVALFHSWENGHVRVLGANQSDRVSVIEKSTSDILEIRRVWEGA